MEPATRWAMHRLAPVVALLAVACSSERSPSGSASEQGRNASSPELGGLPENALLVVQGAWHSDPAFRSRFEDLLAGTDIRRIFVAVDPEQRQRLDVLVSKAADPLFTLSTAPLFEEGPAGETTFSHSTISAAAGDFRGARALGGFVSVNGAERLAAGLAELRQARPDLSYLASSIGNPNEISVVLVATDPDAAFAELLARRDHLGITYDRIELRGSVQH